MSKRKTMPEEPGKPSLVSEILMQLEQLQFEHSDMPMSEALDLALKRAKESLGPEK